MPLTPALQFGAVKVRHFNMPNMNTHGRILLECTGEHMAKYEKLSKLGKPHEDSYTVAFDFRVTDPGAEWVRYDRDRPIQDANALQLLADLVAEAPIPYDLKSRIDDFLCHHAHDKHWPRIMTGKWL